jgi:hypothetical protein
MPMISNSPALEPLDNTTIKANLHKMCHQHQP